MPKMHLRKKKNLFRAKKNRLSQIINFPYNNKTVRDSSLIWKKFNAKKDRWVLIFIWVEKLEAKTHKITMKNRHLKDPNQIIHQSSAIKIHFPTQQIILNPQALFQTITSLKMTFTIQRLLKDLMTSIHKSSDSTKTKAQKAWLQSKLS